MKATDLLPNLQNPRTISDEKLAQLKNAMIEFGDLSGIVFNRKSSQLVGGHQRSAQLPENAVVTYTKKFDKPTRTGTVAFGYVELEGERFTYREVQWDKTRERAANIAANNNAGDWDMPKLREQLKDLGELDDFDMKLTMFGEDELGDLVGHTVKEHTRVGPTGIDEDEFGPGDPEPRAKLGDVWTLGRHRLMCGDSTDLKQVERLMKGAKADLLFTDPPYGVGVGTARNIGGASNIAKRGKYSPIIGDETTDAAKESYQLAQALGVPVLCLWGGNYYSDFCPPTSGWIVWDKRGDMPSNDFADCELAWTNLNKAARIYKQLWSGMIKEGEKGKRVHPTQKPIALAEWCFGLLGESKTVLDLFGGSGSTLIACEKTDRKCFMMELDPRYVDVILHRWEQYTGEKAKRVYTAAPAKLKSKSKRAEQEVSRNV